MCVCFIPQPKKKIIIKETEKKDPNISIKNLSKTILGLFGLWIDFTTQKLFIHLK